MREIDEIFIPLKKSHSGNVQQNVDHVVVLAVSSSRSDPIQRRKWRRLRKIHTYSAPTTPPSRSSEIWWSDRWDRQHDGVVSMMESMRRQGFACLRGGERMEKGGFRNRAAAPEKFFWSHQNRCLSNPLYSRPSLYKGLGHAMQSSAAGCDRIDRIDPIRSYTRAPLAMHPGLLAQRPNRPRHVPKWASQASWPLLDIIESSEPGPGRRTHFFSLLSFLSFFFSFIYFF
jgi:hypothetical protein